MTTKEEVRAILRKLMIIAQAEASDVGFVLIGTTTKGEPRVLHNYADESIGYRVMSDLAEQYATAGMTSPTRWHPGDKADG